MNGKFPQLMKSRKFWAALIAVVMIVVRHYVPNFPISDDQVTQLVYVIVAYIIGTGLEDGGTIKALTTPKV
jgi:hypothetical protein